MQRSAKWLEDLISRIELLEIEDTTLGIETFELE